MFDRGSERSAAAKGAPPMLLQELLSTSCSITHKSVPRFSAGSKFTSFLSLG